MTVLDSIVAELKALPAEKLNAAANYVHRLKERGRKTRNRILRETSGCLSGKAGETFARAVEEGCEKVEPGNW